MSSLADCPPLSCWGWEGRDLPASHIFSDGTSFSDPLGLFHAPIKLVFYRQRDEGAHGSFAPPVTTEIRGLRPGREVHTAHHLETRACEALGPAPCAQRPLVSSFGRGSGEQAPSPVSGRCDCGSPLSCEFRAGPDSTQGLPCTVSPTGVSICGHLCPQHSLSLRLTTLLLPRAMATATGRSARPPAGCPLCPSGRECAQVNVADWPAVRAALLCLFQIISPEGA